VAFESVARSYGCDEKHPWTFACLTTAAVRPLAASLRTEPPGIGVCVCARARTRVCVCVCVCVCASLCIVLIFILVSS
jgi:hypothetical protein